MEEIINLHQQSLSPDFIGQDVTAREILDKASNKYLTYL